jgi:streptogramin lyase
MTSPIFEKLVTTQTTDSQGNLWIVGSYFPEEGTGSKVIRIAPNGTMKIWSFSVELASSGSGYIITVLGRDGDLWATGNGILLHFAMGGSATTVQLPSDIASSGMTVDSDNNVWIAETGANKIGRIHLGL